MDALRLDGNSAAGVLQQVFAAEVTTAVGTCAKCGARDEVGALLVYRSAGIVLRCPHCDAAVMRVVESETRMWLEVGGLRSIEVGL